MIPATGFEGKTVAVFGLGRTGLATARALEAGGATVAAWDDNEKARQAAGADGLALVDLNGVDFSTLAALVLSPGVPLTHPEPHWTVKRSAEAGIPVIGDTELFVRALDAAGAESRLVAVTGTNGKSTTTALIGHILKTAGRDVQIGGNIGRAVLELEPPAPGRIYVVEFSSYQLDLTPGIKPDVALFLNLSPDHLDRHGDMDRYAAVKAGIFANQDVADTAVVGVDDERSAAIASDHPGKARTTRISSQLMEEDGVCADDGVLFKMTSDGRTKLADLRGIPTLRGTHNWQNAVAAAAAVEALGLSAAELAEGLASFPGLAHRMEQVGHKGHVLFINDSKATNADAAVRALGAFDDIFWIAGGQAKAGGISPLAEFFPKIRRSYLIGEAMEDFFSTLDGRVDAIRSGTLDIALEQAASDAAECDSAEAVVLLSPACASFDQFPSFETRGDRFRELVAALDGISMTEEAA